MNLYNISLTALHKRKNPIRRSGWDFEYSKTLIISMLSAFS
jgi:hypothetical protein